MQPLSLEYIRRRLADSQLTFYRGENIYRHGSFYLSDANLADKSFTYQVDGAYGDYLTRIRVAPDYLEADCSCPYPGKGCKHVVAAALNVRDLMQKQEKQQALFPDPNPEYLSREEIRNQSLEDRKQKAASESLKMIPGDLYKGDHLVENPQRRQYSICFHDPAAGRGHCTCPDYMTNGLGTCKHLIFARDRLKRTQGFDLRLNKERFSFVDIFWDSKEKAPALYSEQPPARLADIAPILETCFSQDGRYTAKDPGALMTLADRLAGDKRVRIRENLLGRVADRLHEREVAQLSTRELPRLPLKTDLLSFQQAGIKFGLYKTGVLIGDDMGLGKTLQAIALSVLKKEIFGFSKVLVITPASLKSHWKSTVEAVSHEKAVLVDGNPSQRARIYDRDDGLFKIIAYETALRDVELLSRFDPDIIILDKAQRIRNFFTKTADAVKQIPKKHGIVLTGIPLENNLEDVYSIVQFLDLYLLTPLWEFAADHYLIPKTGKMQVAGYRNLDKLHQRLAHIVIRREKEAVAKELPERVETLFQVGLAKEQQKLHASCGDKLAPVLRKNFLTAMDLRQIQQLMLKMQMVCNSTYLIDRQTHVAPKLRDLAGILDELAVQNRRKVVIFSQWTTMSYLIAKHLSQAGIGFVELSGQASGEERRALAAEFSANAGIPVFLAGDDGIGGLDLSAADCVIHFDLPWHPETIEARINCLGKGRCINVIYLVAKQGIEEEIFDCIRRESDLFSRVFALGPDAADRLRERRQALLSLLDRLTGGAGEILSTGVPDAEAVLETDIVMTGAPEREQVEAVFNSGIDFLAGMLEIAAGRPAGAGKACGKMIRLDEETGQVTITFKLPGFGKDQKGLQ